MERVAFLVEATGQQISCLLNPEGVVLRRRAGLRALQGATGIVTGLGLSDDPLVATGGGVTEIDLDLLFDTEIARELVPPAPPVPPGEAAIVPEPDVRDMTRPLWNLSENGEGPDGYGQPPVVRLIWGRSWNIPGVVTAVAERLERFSPEGRPQRSWLRMRLRRVAGEEGGGVPAAPPTTPQFELPEPIDPALIDTAPSITIAVDEFGVPAPRLDQIVAQAYGDPALTPLIAQINGIDDPLSLHEGQVIRLPQLAPGALA